MINGSFESGIPISHVNSYCQYLAFAFIGSLSVSHAIHSLSDIATDLFNYGFIVGACEPPQRSFSFPPKSFWWSMIAKSDLAIIDIPSVHFPLTRWHCSTALENGNNNNWVFVNALLWSNLMNFLFSCPYSSSFASNFALARDFQSLLDMQKLTARDHFYYY